MAADMSPQAASVLTSSLPNPARNARQVFVAYPYGIYDKTDYRRPFKELAKAFNVDFVFADQKITTLHILQKIADYIRSSRCGIYDVSAWNPNVALELGLAYGLSEKAYVIANPSKHSAGEVPSDLRGIDRVQYNSFNELEHAVETILAAEFPIQPTHGVEDQLAKLRTQALQVIGQSAGLKITDIASLLGISIEIAQVLVRPLVGTELRTEGQRKGTKYFPIEL